LNVKQFHVVTHPKFETAEIDTPKFAVELMADPWEWEAANIGSCEERSETHSGASNEAWSRGESGRGVEILTPDLLRPRQLQKIYLVGPSSFVLRHGTWFWTVFGSIWTQVGPKLIVISITFL
jgi:hypothetical protein